MKTFYASLIVFFLLLALIVCNGVYVRRSTAALEEMLSALSQMPTDVDSLTEIEEAWQEKRKPLSLSVSFEELRALDEQFLSMRAAVTTGEAAEFERARLLAAKTLAHIREFETLSIDNLI